MKSGNLNFLEPSGPLQACNGTSLPLPLPLDGRVISLLKIFQWLNTFRTYYLRECVWTQLQYRSDTTEGHVTCRTADLHLTRTSDIHGYLMCVGPCIIVITEE